MSNNVYRFSYPSNVGEVEIEIYGASASPISSPVYIDIPEDLIVFDKIGAKFDKFPLGLASATALEFRVMMQYAYEFSPEFASLFIAPAVKLTTDVAFSHSFFAGTVIKVTIDDNTDYFVARDEVELEIDAITGEIKVQAIHYAKIVLDSIDFAPFAKGYYLGAVYEKPSAVELWYDSNISSAGFYYTNIKNKHTFCFAKYTDIFVYIGSLADKIKSLLLRLDNASFAISFPDFVPYSQNYENPSQLGDPLSTRYNECYILAWVEKSGSRVGGLLTEEGLLKYKSAWEFYSELAESFLARIYVYGDGIRVRPLLGRYGLLMQTEQIDEDTLSEAKLTVNYARLGVVVGSRCESKASDVSRYESSRPSSRSAGEYTIPIVFSNVPVAATYEKAGVNSWHCFAPHAFGLYYIREGAFHKIHHYMEYFLTSSKTSATMPEASYSPLAEGWQDLLVSEPEIYSMTVQSQSGSHKWAAETLRSVYDRPGQSAIEIRFKPDQWYADPFVVYWQLSIASVADFAGLVSYNWLCVEYDYDMISEEYSMKLVTVPNDAI